MSTTTDTLTATLQHESWCTPRPGETEPRTEAYRATRTDEDGRVTSRPLVARCLECAAQVVQG